MHHDNDDHDQHLDHDRHHGHNMVPGHGSLPSPWHQSQCDPDDGTTQQSTRYYDRRLDRPISSYDLL